MSTSRELKILATSIAAVALGVAITSAGAGAQSSPTAACTAAASARAPFGLGSQAVTTRSSALTTYDDEIEDVVTAPDICQQNLMTNDSEVLTVAIHMHDRSTFAAADAYSVILDTDANPATGAPPSGAETGAEFVVDLADRTSALRAWTGTAFEPVTPQPDIPTEWLDGYGPILQIARSALGNPQRLTFLLRTRNGDDVDLAPDSGSWSYTVTPFRLTAGRLAVGPARAGKLLTAALRVTRSDFEVALQEGTLSCRATVSGRKLAGRGSFVGGDDGFVACAWRVPRNVSGKRVRGSVSVTFQGVTVKRSFVVRVR